MTQITLDLDDTTLSRLQIAAMAQNKPVPKLVEELLRRDAEMIAEGESSVHQKMMRILEERSAYYKDKGFSREETYDRDYSRAQLYAENRQRLLKRIDETQGDMGKQKWNRSSLYES
jgi:hypothetical protein